MKKLTICGWLLLMTTTDFGQQNNSLRINFTDSLRQSIFETADPQYNIRLNTISGSLLLGLFLYAGDSMIAVYPGSWNEWKQRKNFKTVFFKYDRVDKIELKKKKSFLRRSEKFMIAGSKERFHIFTSSVQEGGNDKRINFFISVKTGKFDIAMVGSQWQAKFKSLFHKNFYCIIVRSPEQMIRKATTILKNKNAMIGSIWFDSHGYFSRRHSSFQIGETEFSHQTLKDSMHAWPFVRLSAYTDPRTRVGIGSCYGGATYRLPAVENFEEERMNGDSLMISVGRLLNGAIVYGSESFVMSVPGMFGGGYKLAGGPPNKHFVDPVYKPVWENLGKWNCYDARADSFFQVNVVSLNGNGSIRMKEQSYLSFKKNKKKQSKKLKSLKVGNYDIGSFFRETHF